MAQNPPRLCPNCGTPAEPNQRFCAECGTTLSVVSNSPTALASGERPALSAQGSGAQFATQPEPGNGVPGNTATAPTQLVGAPGQTPGSPTPPYSTANASGSQFYAQTTEANPIPPPPPPDSLIAPPYQSLSQTPANTPPAQPTPAPGTYSEVPDYARAPRRSRTGLIVSLVLLLVLALGGVAAYALFFNKPNKSSGTNPQTTATTSVNTPGSGNVTATTGTGNASTPGSSSTTPTTSASTTVNGATTESVNLAFNFSGIDLTITTVQYAQSFSDDNSITSGGVRINLNEKNATSANPRYYYPDIARLILTDNSAIAPSQEKNFSNPDSQTTSVNWLDFPVTSQPADLSQLALQMGGAQQNQMLIPLKAGADISKYQPKTTTPGTKFQYAGMNWTLKSATESYGIAGSQASSGNVYITLELGIANPTSSDYSGYYGDIARLTAGGSTNAPTSDSNLPTIASQSNGSATLVFLAPQGNTSFTLMMLAMPSASPPVQGVPVSFTIQ